MDLAQLTLGVDSTGLKKGTDETKKFGDAADTAADKADDFNDTVVKTDTVTNKLAGSLKGLLGPITAIAGAFLSGISLRQFIDSSTQAQAVQVQLAAALKSTGGVAGQTIDALNEHAASLQKITNYGDEVINTAQGVLLTFKNVRGDEFGRATEAVLDLSTAMKMDLQSAALQVGKALNDPILGMTALQRAGIQFSESQKAVIKDLVETGRVAEAQRLVLAELETQFGGSAKAARDTLGGALTSLGNAWGDLFELSQGATSGVQAAIEALIVAISDPAFMQFAQFIGTTLMASFQVAIMGITGIVNTINLLVENIDILSPALIALGILLTATFGPAVLASIVSLTGAIGVGAVNAVLAFNAALLANPIAVLTAGIVGLMAYLIDWEMVIKNLIQTWALFTYEWYKFWGDEAGMARSIEIGINAGQAVEELKASAAEIRNNILVGFEGGTDRAAPEIENAMARGGASAAAKIASAQSAAVARYEQMNGKAVKELGSTLIEGGKYIYNQASGEVKAAGKSAASDINKGVVEGGKEAASNIGQSMVSAGQAAGESFEAAGVRLTGSIISMFVLELKSLVTLQMQLIDAQIAKLHAEAYAIRKEARDGGGDSRNFNGRDGSGRGREIRIVEDYGEGWDPYRGRLLPGETAPADPADPAPPPGHRDSMPNITNVLSPDNMLSVLDTSAGHRQFINVIKYNRDEIANLLGST